MCEVCVLHVCGSCVFVCVRLCVGVNGCVCVMYMVCMNGMYVCRMCVVCVGVVCVCGVYIWRVWGDGEVVRGYGSVRGGVAVRGRCAKYVLCMLLVFRV